MVGSDGRWRDPWPSPQVAYGDPPWTMTGRVLTAWFELPREVATRVLSSSLQGRERQGRRNDGVRARLRFYDVAYRSTARRTSGALRQGRFREAVVALDAAAGDVRGEVSPFMWTDSDPYLAWGREVFGWPLLRAAFELSGELWSGELDRGALGGAIARTDSGDVRLMEVRVGRPIQPPASGPWLTPRLVHRRGGLDPSERELLVVHPAIRRRGRWFSAECQLGITFEPPHPLAGLQVPAINADIVDGIQLMVPDRVTVL